MEALGATGQIPRRSAFSAAAPDPQTLAQAWKIYDSCSLAALIASMDSQRPRLSNGPFSRPQKG